MLARDALAAFRADYGRRTASIEARWIWVKLGFFRIPVPNPGHLLAHDLHHAILGAPPTLAGEAQVGVFELRTGCANALVWFLCAGSVLIGLFQRPRSVFRWWRAYRDCKTLYRHPELERLLELDVEVLRERVGAPSLTKRV